jgi:hypothetical protein
MAATRLGAFTPSFFVEQVTAAVLPLIDVERATELAEGNTRADVEQALLPLFGHCTVEDAVYAHRLLFDAGVHWSNPEVPGDDPRLAEIYEARELLVHFICNGISTGPACAAARASFAERGDGDGDKLPDDLYCCLHFRISHDISNLRQRRFQGERLADHFGLSVA